MRKPSFMKIVFTLIQKHNFDLAIFLGTYGGVFKVISKNSMTSNYLHDNALNMYITNFGYIKLWPHNTFLQLISCLLRGTLQTNQPELVAAPAGFLAGLSSMSLFRSTSITIYTAWKTIDVRLIFKIKIAIEDEFYS